MTILTSKELLYDEKLTLWTCFAVMQYYSVFDAMFSMRILDLPCD